MLYMLPVKMLYLYIAKYSDMFECYDNIIGFTATDCACTNLPSRPADYNVSKSGIYLDELTPIGDALGLAECDKTMWDILVRSRDAAIKQFVSDTNSLLAERYRVKRKAATGNVIGTIKEMDTYNPTKNYGVVRLVCAPVRSGVMRINSIGTLFAATGSITVSLYNSVDGHVEDFIINTTADKHTPNAINKEYPLFDKHMRNLNYYLVYQFDNLNLPKANVIDCGCSNWEPTFNLNQPYYNNIGHPAGVAWTDWVMVGSTSINSLSELDYMHENSTGYATGMLGLVLDVDFSCKVSEVICKDALNFSGNMLALSMAVAIKYGTAVNVAEAIMKSPLLNRANMIAQAEWVDSVVQWQERYNEQTNYVAAEADITANDCLTCKDVLGMTRKGLFS